MISTPLRLTCQACAQARVGDHFSLAMYASGSSLPTITVRGLPFGLTALSGYGRVTISGTPQVRGRQNVHITARDKAGEVNQVLVIDVLPRPPVAQPGGIKSPDWVKVNAGQSRQ
jgi:hypothetical protein